MTEVRASRDGAAIESGPVAAAQGETQRRAAPRPNAVVLYVVALAAGAIASCFALRGMGSIGSPSAWALPPLAALLVAAEYLFVRFRFRGEISAINVNEAVLAPLLFAFPPVTAVAVAAGSQVVAAILRRNAPTKAAFNVAQWALATAAGAAVLHATASRGPVSVRTVAAVLAALAAVGLVNQAAFTVVLCLTTQQPLRQLLRGLASLMAVGWCAGWVVNSLVGILFVLAYAAHPGAVVLFATPLAVLHLAYRGFAAARTDRARITGVHRAARVLGEPVDPADATFAFLREVASSFEARAAVLVVADDRGTTTYRVTTGAVSGSTEVSVPGVPGLEASLLSHDRARRVTGRASTSEARLLMDAGWRECLVAPFVAAADGVDGGLLVFDQAGLEAFEAVELAVIEALARETAGILAKGRLLSATMAHRRQLSEIVETTSDGIMTIDESGRVLSWNPALERITGWTASVMVGDGRALDRLAATGATGRLDLGEWRASRRALPADLTVTTASGGRRRLSCSYSRTAERDLTGRTLVVIARDVTPVEEIEELRERFGQLAEAEAAQRAVVQQLQRALTPGVLAVPGIDLGVSFVASDDESPTGGDLYDWQLLPSGELHVAVVDVLGHGVAAAKDALSVIHALRFLTLQGCPLEDLVGRADALLGGQHQGLVATVVVVRLNAETGEFRVAGGGHPPPVLVSSDGEVCQLVAPGGAIGWPMAGSEHVVSARLDGGASLVLYTDGLIEARKDILQGMDALMAHAAAVASRPADELAAELVERSLSGAARRDDSLALVIRRRPEPSAPSPPASSSSSLAAEGEHAVWTASARVAEVPALRASVSSWLDGRVGDPEDRDDVLLVASELLTNAIRVARHAVRLRVSLTDGTISVEVEDDGAGDPGLSRRGEQQAGLSDEAGRGLFIVRALVDHVDIETSDAGSRIRGTKWLAGQDATVRSRPEGTDL